MKLFILRHAETEENITEMLQGDMDTVLNKKGIEQSFLVRDKIIESNIDLVISSPKKRATETARIAAPNIPMILDDRLRSRSHGEFEGKSRSDVDIHEYWNFYKNNQYERAESVQEMFKRIKSLIDEIKEKYSDKNVLLVTHSGVCRILYYYFNGIPEDGDLIGYESYNCSFEQYEL